MDISTRTRTIEFLPCHECQPVKHLSFGRSWMVRLIARGRTWRV
jgi:hypothetical protein